MRTFLAFVKLALFAVWSLFCIPLQLAALQFTNGPGAYYVPVLWHAGVLKIFRLRVRVKGQPVTGKQVFFVGNHLSHFDIFALGSLIRASFVAKEEVGQWAGIGFLANLQQTAYISRASGQANVARNNIQRMIEDGKSIVLFPEGTSTRGTSVLDFKSSLFSLPLQFAGRGLVIQPFTILLREVDGKTADTKELQDLYAWDRDNPIGIGPHIWNFLLTRGAAIEIVFHPAVAMEKDEDRKVLANRVREIVAAPLEETKRPV